MSIRTAAAREEEAELNELRDQVDRATAELAQTLAELTRRISVLRRPGGAARRLTADARVTALRALHGGPGSTTAGQRGAWRPALAAIPVAVLTAALGYAAYRRKLALAKIKVSAPERIRLTVRRYR